MTIGLSIYLTVRLTHFPSLPSEIGPTQRPISDGNELLTTAQHEDGHFGPAVPAYGGVAAQAAAHVHQRAPPLIPTLQVAAIIPRGAEHTADPGELYLAAVDMP